MYPEVERTNCFSCSKLRAVSPYFSCEESKILFSANEKSPVVYCKICDDAYPKMHGRAVDLYRLLCILGGSVCVQSLPRTFVGAVGVLSKYNKVIYRSSVVKTSKKGRSSTDLKKDIFIKLVGL